MFTGLIQAKGVVERIDPTGAGVRLVVDASRWEHRPGHGESIAVSGVCLTCTEFDSGRLHFDVVSETLARSTLGSLRPGDRVNLEHSCRADTLLGGHIVQGHVDGIGKVTRISSDPADWRVTIQPPYDLMECIAPKGSVSLEGVSLTIAAAGERTFEVALIPTTLDLTTLGGLVEGSLLNIETDIISRTVVNWLKRQAPRH